MDSSSANVAIPEIRVDSPLQLPRAKTYNLGQNLLHPHSQANHGTN